ncbi:MAG: CBS domain-containing protein [Atribacterota bacterium]|nr:CBS domain-containing protein [Atribacterota bacterium]MDD4895501.1 CBS domain-containing protein [Atribacterota bacterium]MDD5636321.1 CBS domain-containing protein [Atribacterota bacterium]
MKIKDFMHRNTASVLSNCSLEEVIKIMALQRINGIPIVDENQKVIGFISQHDIIKALLPNYLTVISSNIFLTEFIQLSKKLKEYAHFQVKEFMNKEVITINEDDNEVMAADLLIRYKIHHLPVLRNGYLAGIVTMRDLLKAMIEQEEEQESNQEQET